MFQELECGVLKLEKDYFIECVAERFGLLYGDAHGYGNLLDPRYFGDGMDIYHEDSTENFKDIVEDHLFKFPITFEG